MYWVQLDKSESAIGNIAFAIRLSSFQDSFPWIQQRGQSPVWAYFDKLSNGKASCKTCRYIFQVRQIILLVESESFHPGGGELTSGSPTSCSRPKWRWRRSTWANTRTRVWRWSSPILTFLPPQSWSSMHRGKRIWAEPPPWSFILI